jgi:hypothetical protein
MTDDDIARYRRDRLLAELKEGVAVRETVGHRCL